MWTSTVSRADVQAVTAYSWYVVNFCIEQPTRVKQTETFTYVHLSAALTHPSNSFQSLSSEKWLDFNFSKYIQLFTSVMVAYLSIVSHNYVAFSWAHDLLKQSFEIISYVSHILFSARNTAVYNVHYTMPEKSKFVLFFLSCQFTNYDRCYF